MPNERQTQAKTRAKKKEEKKKKKNWKMAKENWRGGRKPKKNKDKSGTQKSYDSLNSSLLVSLSKTGMEGE